MYLNIDDKLSYIDEKRIVGKFDYSKLDDKYSYFKEKEKLISKYDILNARLILDAVKDHLISLDGKYLKADFSGGNDEGGFDGVSLLDFMEEEIELKPFSKDVLLWELKHHVEKGVDYFIEKQVTSKLNFPNDFEAIFNNAQCLHEWGSFAGDFNVEGSFLMNIENGEWKMEGRESTESYEDINSEGAI